MRCVSSFPLYRWWNWLASNYYAREQLVSDGELLFPHPSFPLDPSNYTSGSFKTPLCLSIWSLGQKYHFKKECFRFSCLVCEWYDLVLSLSHLIFLLFLYLEFTVTTFYKLGTFIFRNNWLENTVLCNRKRCFRNVNRRKKNQSDFPDVSVPFFFVCSLVNYSVGSIQNTNLTTCR